MKVVIDETLTGKELYAFLKDNKAALIAQKKYEVKRGDAVSYSRMLLTEKGEAVKANEPVTNDNLNNIEVLSVINTTNIMDSHKDVHIPGLWKKSLQENKDLYLLQEHDMSFKGIITDNVKASTKKIAWKALGLDVPGETEALIFDSTIGKDRNEYMFGEYQKGHVKNHSVGMRYVKIDLAVNEPEDKYYRDEYEVWQKYIDQVANKTDAEESGYFWAVTEAKVLEGSAVPIGSNRVTPTLNVSESTKRQPDLSTEVLPPSFDISKAIKETTFIKI
jgi:hypothetical protein